MRRLLISVTLTVTWGLLMYFFNPSVMTLDSSIGEMPAACTSFSRGRDTLPSGRTGVAREISGSFHTSMRNTSWGPILYVASLAGMASAAWVFLFLSLALAFPCGSGFWGSCAHAACS